eukprot:scaffold873_cov252-Pinguiococcus_pyrenoidosus.AAC.22
MISHTTNSSRHRRSSRCLARSPVNDERFSSLSAGILSTELRISDSARAGRITGGEKRTPLSKAAGRLPGPGLGLQAGTGSGSGSESSPETGAGTETGADAGTDANIGTGSGTGSAPLKAGWLPRPCCTLLFLRCCASSTARKNVINGREDKESTRALTYPFVAAAKAELVMDPHGVPAYFRARAQLDRAVSLAN